MNRQLVKKNYAVAIEENLIKFWSNLDIELQYSQPLTLYKTTIPHFLLNGVLRSRLSFRNAEDHIEKVINYFQWQKLPFTWWVESHSTPGDLGILLERFGLSHYGIYSALSLELYHSKLRSTAGNNLTVEQIGLNQMEEWNDVQRKIYSFSSDITASFAKLYAKPFVDPASPFRQFLAKLNGNPVGVATLFIQNNEVCIYNLCVLPDSRKQGIGTSIVENLINYAKDSSCKVIFAITTMQDQGLFHPLGFQKQSNLNAYTWLGNEPKTTTNPYAPGV